MEQIKNRLYIQSNVTFEPTISIFKKAIVINYKKVGTRFLRELASHPNDVNEDNKQIDLQYRRDQYNSNVGESDTLQYLNKQYHIYTPWDWDSNLDMVESYKNWHSLQDFLDSEGVSNFTELLLENPNKEIVFLVRNPIKRFFSGIVQVLAAYLEQLKDETEREQLKLIKNLQDSDIDYLIEAFEFQHNNNKATEIIHIYIEYLIQTKWDLILQDIHTENYLQHYIEFIYNIKDKSKIKIIDLDDCNSDSAYEFFREIRDDEELRLFWKRRRQYIDSNKHLYDSAIDILGGSEDDTIFHYLKREYACYEELINSKHFVKI